jgi:hypothetical protein
VVLDCVVLVEAVVVVVLLGPVCVLDVAGELALTDVLELDPPHAHSTSATASAAISADALMP